VDDLSLMALKTVNLLLILRQMKSLMSGFWHSL